MERHLPQRWSAYVAGMVEHGSEVDPLRARVRDDLTGNRVQKRRALTIPLDPSASHEILEFH
jgi:hypothetical protein